MNNLLDSLLKDCHFIDGELQKLDYEMERIKLQREMLFYKRRLTAEAISRLEESLEIS